MNVVLDEEFGPDALTPNHMIHGRRVATLAWEQPESDNEIDATRRWKHLKKQLQHFWKRWNREYISSLREHHRLNSETSKSSLKPGAIVYSTRTSCQEGLSRSRWKLGRVDRLIAGNDGVTRRAVLKVVSNDRIHTVERPLQKLCPLELYADESDGKGVESVNIVLLRPYSNPTTFFSIHSLIHIQFRTFGQSYIHTSEPTQTNNPYITSPYPFFVYRHSSNINKSINPSLT